MRVEVDDVERLRVRAHDRVRDAVVAAQHDRQGAPLEEPPRHRGDVVERPGHVGRQHVRVARVDDAAVGELVAQELPPERRVVVPLAPRPEAHRVLPDPARAEPGARHERRPLVARDAHHGDVGVEPVEVGGDDRPEEGRDADERRVPARPGRRLHGAGPQAPTRAGARAAGPLGRRRDRCRAARAPSRSRGAPPRSRRPAARPGTPPPIPIMAQAALSAGSQCPTSWIRAEVEDRRLDPRARGRVAPARRVPQLDEERRDDVRQPGDQAVAAQPEAGRGEVLVALEHPEVRPRRP